MEMKITRYRIECGKSLCRWIETSYWMTETISFAIIRSKNRYIYISTKQDNCGTLTEHIYLYA